MGEALSEELERVRAGRKAARRKRYRPSRLDRHRSQIEALAAAGASTGEIRIWLRQHARVKVAQSTVWRALARWRRQAEG